jgi:3-deoxy-manno-octulosonate cytidylyltransferase (CMP-KDO synthetase)
MKDCLVVIPARLGSRRLPGKPLIECGGKPLLWHVWQNAITWDRAARVIVATDSTEILTAARDFGAEAVATPDGFRNGTQRCLWVWHHYQAPAHHRPILVNLQGDEVRLTPDLLSRIPPRGKLSDPMIWTLSAPFATEFQRRNRNEVKVVTDVNHRALYFSRHPLPGARRHVGLYAFNTEIIPMLEEALKGNRTALDRAENLEQLAWLEAGLGVVVGRTNQTPLAVNTLMDVTRFRNFLKGSEHNV